MAKSRQPAASRACATTLTQPARYDSRCWGSTVMCPATMTTGALLFCRAAFAIAPDGRARYGGFAHAILDRTHEAPAVMGADRPRLADRRRRSGVLRRAGPGLPPAAAGGLGDSGRCLRAGTGRLRRRTVRVAALPPRQLVAVPRRLARPECRCGRLGRLGDVAAVRQTRERRQGETVMNSHETLEYSVAQSFSCRRDCQLKEP